MDETIQWQAIRLGDRPLVVCDVDDVVLQFVQPFQDFLADRGHRLVPRSFRLTGNIVSLGNGEAIGEASVRQLIDDFFDEQERWQSPAERAVEVLADLAADADIVFLTAMPPRYFDRRRRLLDRLGFAQPLIASEAAKGPAVDRLHGRRPLPVVFVDDMVHNLASVGEHVETCLLLHLQPESDIHRFAPVTPATALKPADWNETGSMIRAHWRKS